MKIATPELMLDAKAVLAESPVWDAEQGRLFWVNSIAGELHIYDPASKSDQQINLDEAIGCVAPHRSDSAILALQTGFALLNLSIGKLERIANPELDSRGNRFNDGKCDPAGRFVAGTMDIAEKKASGSLYSLDKVGNVTRLLNGIYVSNGLAWSPDHKTFYHIDTLTRKVMAYDYDLGSGRIANPRVAVRVAWADGMTSDRQGRLWIALWNGPAISVWDPGTGKLLEKISIPAGHVTSCVFGGHALNELYITTARKDLDSSILAAYPATGGIFRVRTDVEGMPTFNSNYSAVPENGKPLK